MALAVFTIIITPFYAIVLHAMLMQFKATFSGHLTFATTSVKKKILV